jgi:hypothetical protein
LWFSERTSRNGIRLQAKTWAERGFGRGVDEVVVAAGTKQTRKEWIKLEVASQLGSKAQVHGLSCLTARNDLCCVREPSNGPAEMVSGFKQKRFTFAQIVSFWFKQGLRFVQTKTIRPNTAV